MNLAAIDCMVAKGTITQDTATSLILIMKSLPENEVDLLQILVALTIIAL